MQYELVARRTGLLRRKRWTWQLCARSGEIIGRSVACFPYARDAYVSADHARAGAPVRIVKVARR